MHLARSRSLFLLAFIACALIIGATLYLEHGLGLVPCPLCTLQRGFMIIFGVICLTAVLHAPGTFGWRIYSFLLLLCALAGAGAAGFQVWLQSVSINELSSCAETPGIRTAVPLIEIVSHLLDNAIDCAEITWSLFGMSIAEWSLLAFVGMTLFAAYQLLQRYGAGSGEAKPADNAGED